MLSAEQIGFFKTQGYLLIPGLLNAAGVCEVRDAMWAALPESSALQRADATTHLGPFSSADSSADATHVRSEHRWLNRALGVSRAVIDLVYSETICGIAEQLLGGPLRQAVVGGTPMGAQGPAWPGGPTDPALGNEGARGVYCTLPYGECERQGDACHTDGHPFQLGLVGLLEATPPDGGAFKVWPGSHRLLYPTFQLRYDQPRIPFYDHLPSYKGIVHTPAYLQAIEHLNNHVTPVECYGQAGDVVLWHHRLAHMAGHNYSTQIRQAVLADFWKMDLDHSRALPVEEDMWLEWSPNLRNNPGTYTSAFAESQRLPTNAGVSNSL